MRRLQRSSDLRRLVGHWPACTGTFVFSGKYESFQGLAGAKELRILFCHDAVKKRRLRFGDREPLKIGSDPGAKILPHTIQGTALIHLFLKHIMGCDNQEDDHLVLKAERYSHLLRIAIDILT